MRGRQRSWCWCVCRTDFAGIRTWRYCFALATFARDYHADNDDDQEQPEQEKHHDYDADDPHRKTRFLFALCLQLLSALNEAIDFRVLRKQSLDLFKLGNCRRVVLVPVLQEAFTPRCVGWTFSV